MIRSILQVPDQRLRERAFTLYHRVGIEGDFNGRWELRPETSSVCADLRDTFAVTKNCIGLAAPQLGHPWRACIVATNRKDTYLMIDPVIIKQSENKQLVMDGCMSISNGLRKGQTGRPKRIEVCWLDEAGLPQRQKFSGLIAAAIHHEIDHLDGVLFLDRLLGQPWLRQPVVKAGLQP